MASVDLVIGGNSYSVSCRDGEEGHLQALAAIVDAKAHQARGAVGSVSEGRQLLLAALLLADELTDARAVEREPIVASGDAVAIDDAALSTLADKMEALATRLEKSAASD